MKKWLLGIVAAALLAAGYAFAQVPCFYCVASPTGLEQIQVLIPSTSGTGAMNSPYPGIISVNQIRNATGYLLVAAGTTVSTTIPNTAQTLIAQGAITTWNVTLPLAPYDGQLVKVSCPGGNVGTLTIAAGATPAGATIVGTNPTSCTASSGGGAQFAYSLSANAWYRE